MFVVKFGLVGLYTKLYSHCKAAKNRHIIKHRKKHKNMTITIIVMMT